MRKVAVILVTILAFVSVAVSWWWLCKLVASDPDIDPLRLSLKTLPFNFLPFVLVFFLTIRTPSFLVFQWEKESKTTTGQLGTKIS